MKMTDAQYALLIKEKQKMEAAYSIAAIREHRNTVAYAKNQFVSFIWSMLWKIKPGTRALIIEGLLDTHIETALKKCWAEYI